MHLARCLIARCDRMSYDEVAEKFRGCAAFAAWLSSKANQVIAMVRSLEDLSDVPTLTALLQ
jgi:hypothetical protein